METLHFITGSTGAGKTTYARRLADEIGAVRFSIDEWMAALFWMDAPQPMDSAWAMARIERCRERIWQVALDIVARDTPVLLELGFTTRAVRQAFAARAAAAGVPVRLHLLDVPAAERWRRVEARNARLAEEGQLDFPIDRTMFDYVEAMWEAPDDVELAALNGVRAT